VVGGTAVVEDRFTRDEVYIADEVFITGTAAEVTPVGEIGPHNFQVGPITRHLMADYEALVRTG